MFVDSYCEDVRQMRQDSMDWIEGRG